MSDSPMRSLLGPIRRSLRKRFYLAYGMRGTAPINPDFGASEGTPVDRHYIQSFLGMNSGVITGRVLEIGDRRYTSRFGVDVTQSDVLSAEADDATTYVGDLSSCPQIPADAYDCFILTQTLHYLYDMEAGVREIHRILKPGGTVLCTVPGISQISRFDMDRWGDRWRLTSLSAAELFGTTFSSDAVRVATFGNAHSAACFLQGIPAERVNKTKLERNEPDYQLIVAVRATKHADG